MSIHTFEFIEDYTEYTAVVYAVEEEKKSGALLQLSRKDPEIKTHQLISTIELIKQRIIENPEDYYSWHIVGYGNRKNTRFGSFRDSCGKYYPDEEYTSPSSTLTVEFPIVVELIVLEDKDDKTIIVNIIISPIFLFFIAISF
ncbi:MAG: hypothetical protein ACTSRT_15085 [Promethearchaeota archaeon]